MPLRDAAVRVCASACKQPRMVGCKRAHVAHCQQRHRPPLMTPPAAPPTFSPAVSSATSVGAPMGENSVLPVASSVVRVSALSLARMPPSISARTAPISASLSGAPGPSPASFARAKVPSGA